jgi:hypothetical protein
VRNLHGGGSFGQSFKWEDAPQHSNIDPQGLLVTATQRDKNVERAKAPVFAENARLITRAEKTEVQRDEMLK